MIKRTHLAIGAFLALLFLEQVRYKLVFIPVVLLASLLPDIDSAYSYLGHHKVFRPLQFFVRHRGLIHSFTFCVAISVLLAFFFPVVALGFFVGYAGHLFSDSLTVEGIRPFWPLEKESVGKIRVGGRIETGVFTALCIADAVLFVGLFI